MSTTYHPQTDGQTERANRTLEEMLRAYVDWRQSDWDVHLSTLEMAYNNSKQVSTGFTPHYLNFGQEMRLPLDGAIPSSSSSSNPESADRIGRLHSDLVMAKSKITIAQERQRKYADQHRRDVKFNVGDKVLMSTDHLRVIGDNRSPKLHSKYIGPFKVKRVVGDNAYELDLPSSMPIHPVLNISRLKSYRDGALTHPNRSQPITRPPPACIREDGVEQFEIEHILDSRGRGNRLQYLIQWRGYPSWESTWESYRSVMDATDHDALAEFNAEMEAKKNGAAVSQ